MSNKFENFLKRYLQDKKKYANAIKRSLSPASPFTAFKRWIVRDNDPLKQEFADFLKD